MTRERFADQYPTEPHGRILSFKSLEEEAAFWDRHDFTDYLDESEPVTVTVGQELSDRLTLRLERSDREAVARRAAELGIGPSTPIRMWIKERLQHDRDASGAAER